jgi:hypothetical protein
MFLVLAALPDILSVKRIKINEKQFHKEVPSKVNFSTNLFVNSPGVLKCFAASVSLVDIDTHQPTDEILGRITNVVPVWRVELKFAYFKDYTH